MLYRRRILLALLQALGDGLQRVEFQKHLFLFSHAQEAPSYEFIPYKYGSFSFVAESDRLALVEQGKLVDSEVWSRPRYFDYAAGLKDRDKAALVAHKHKFGKLRGKKLIRHVYRHYPYFAINSTIAKEVLTAKEFETVGNARPTSNDVALLTIGYEGKTIEGYLNQLIGQSTDILCDVRRNPLSRKYGFSKERLRKAVESVGIEYHHFPNLGIPSAKRKSLETQADYDRLFDQYEQEILPDCSSDLGNILSLLEKGKRVALTCFELHPERCHRSRVTKAIEQDPRWQFSLFHL